MKRLKKIGSAVSVLLAVFVAVLVGSPRVDAGCWYNIAKKCVKADYPSGVVCNGAARVWHCTSTDSFVDTVDVGASRRSGQSIREAWNGACTYDCYYTDCEGIEHWNWPIEGVSGYGASGPACTS